MPQRQAENLLLLKKGSKVPQPAKQPLKKSDQDHRPKLSLVDANCTALTTRRDSKTKPITVTKSVNVTLNVTTQNFTLKAPATRPLTEKEHDEKCKKLLGRKPSMTSGGGVKTTSRTSRTSKQRALRLLGESRMKDSFEIGRSELALLEPDCRPSLNALATLYLEKDCPDVEDIHDPQQCAMYVHEIYYSLLTAERSATFRINHDLVMNCRSTDINASHRRVLINWMVQVHINFNLVADSLHIAVDILDRYLQQKGSTVTKKNLQLVGITGMLIASKYEDIYPPSIADLADIAADTYTTEQIRHMETEILTVLRYQLGKPNTLTFLRRYSKLMSTTTQTHNLGKFIIEACYLTPDSRRLLPSQLAVGALLLAASAMTVIRKEDRDSCWSPVMEKYTWYSKEMATIFAREVAKQMNAYFHMLSTNKNSNNMAVSKKYSESCYHCVASLPTLEHTLQTLHSSNMETSTTTALQHFTPLFSTQDLQSFDW